MGWGTRLADPYAAEGEIHGILADCGCGSSTPCGSGAACMAYGRLMAFALFGIGLVRATCAVSRGSEVWLMGISMHGELRGRGGGGREGGGREAGGGVITVASPRPVSPLTSLIHRYPPAHRYPTVPNPTHPPHSTHPQWPRAPFGGVRPTRWRCLGSRRCLLHCSAFARWPWRWAAPRTLRSGAQQHN